MAGIDTTKRPKGGATYTLATDAAQVVPVPGYATQVDVVCTLGGGRVVSQRTNTTAAKTATNMGYLGANIPMTIRLLQDKDTFLVLDNDNAAANTFYLTFFN